MTAYIPIYLDFVDAARELSDAETGRLIKALVTYARGEDWQDKIKGNEKYVFHFMTGYVDRHFEYLATQRERGKSGAQARLSGANAQSSAAKLGQANNNENNNNNNNDNENNNGVTVRAHSVRFTPPTIDELKVYCTEQGYKIDTDRFLAYYESNGWRVGRNPMKDWKAAVRTWVRNDATGSQPSKPTPTAMQFEQRDYTGVDFSNLNADLSKYK